VARGCRAESRSEHKRKANQNYRRTHHRRTPQTGARSIVGWRSLMFGQRLRRQKPCANSRSSRRMILGVLLRLANSERSMPGRSPVTGRRRLFDDHVVYQEWLAIYEENATYWYPCNVKEKDPIAKYHGCSTTKGIGTHRFAFGRRESGLARMAQSPHRKTKAGAGLRTCKLKCHWRNAAGERFVRGSLYETPARGKRACIRGPLRTLTCIWTMERGNRGARKVM